MSPVTRCVPSRCQGLAGGFLFATLATCDRSLPIPLDVISSSLHRPLIGTPRCASWHREAPSPGRGGGKEIGCGIPRTSLQSRNRLDNPSCHEEGSWD